MIISYKWLLEYLPEALSTEELSRILTSIGLEVEALERIETIKGGLEGLVIGEVLTCEKHPNADKLKITTVNIGGEVPLNIVCGAPNVAAGQKVIVAPVGTTVHPTSGEAFSIKKAKIRGENSEGMICAEDEIGMSSNHEGVLVLPEDAPVGELAKVYFNIADADFAIHIGLTPNRSDAMSHIGVARDVCAYLTHHNGKPYSVRIPEAHLQSIGAHTVDIKVQVEAVDACPRYAGIAISDVKVGPSPEWLQQRLTTIGLRSINNVVDVTNFVLHEYGQPLHAFDVDAIKGNEIHVRFLQDGAKFTTLDSKEIKLRDKDLMICNNEDGMCIAGVFGGLHSGVNERTTKVFLECAYFTPSYIRSTSLYHGMRTDAATHFEKGVDINNIIPALKRAAALICSVSGGNIASDLIDVYPMPVEPVTIDVLYSYVQKLSGKAYSPEAIKDILIALGFVLSKESREGVTVTVPSNKTDVLQPADIVEEVLRIDGLDNIAIPERLNISLSKRMVNDADKRDRIASLLCGMGMQELVTNSITNSKYYSDRTDLVRMLNSLSSELDVMRPSMLESGLDVIQYNVNRKSSDLALFEFGKTYTQSEGKYIEVPQLAIWITGNAQAQHWNQKAAKTDLYYLKGIINNLLTQSGIYNVSTRHIENNGITEVNWIWKNKQLCAAIEVPQSRLDLFDIRQDVYFAAIDWEVWLSAAAANKVKYSEVPKFPAVQRDLAIVLDKQVTYEQVQQATEQLKLDALQTFDLFDVFESEKLGAGKKSYALSYTFQLQDRTLTDAEIEQLMQQLAGAYKNKLQAQIRE